MQLGPFQRPELPQALGSHLAGKDRCELLHSLVIFGGDINRFFKPIYRLVHARMYIIQNDP